MPDCWTSGGERGEIQTTKQKRMLQYPDIFNTSPGRITNETAAAQLLWAALIQNQNFPNHKQNWKICFKISLTF